MNNLSYYKAFKENNYSADGTLLSFIKKSGQQFHYGKTDFEQFAAKYHDAGWVGRKVIALPAAAWTGVVKTTLNLALAILFGIPKALFDDGTYFKAQIFHVCRDLQAAAGRIISIFNDEYGLYLIEESQVQKKFYEIFLDDEEIRQAPPQPTYQPRNSENTSDVSNSQAHRNKEVSQKTIHLTANNPEESPDDVKKEYEVDLKNIVTRNVTSKNRTVTMLGGSAKNVTAEHEVDLNGTEITGNVQSILRSVKMVGGNPINVSAEHEVDLKDTKATGDICSHLREVTMVGGSAKKVCAEHEINLDKTDVTGNVKSKLRSIKMVGGNPIHVVAEHEVNLNGTHVRGYVKSKRSVKMKDSSAKILQISTVLMPPLPLRSDIKDQISQFLDPRTLSQVVNLEKSTLNIIEIKTSFLEYSPNFEGEVVISLSESVIHQGIKVSGIKDKSLKIIILGTGRISGDIIIEGCKGTVELDNRIAHSGKIIKPN